MPRTRVVQTLILFLLTAAPLFSETPLIEGRWKGSINIPPMPLEIEIDFEKVNDRWSGDITIPAQNARDLPLSDIVLVDRGVSFRISGVPGAPAFKGTLAEDGTKISGDFTQAGQTFPFSVERTGKEDLIARLNGFEEFVQGALKPWDVPGLALAVVAGGKVIYAQGVGYRDVGNQRPMTPHSLMPIGSITKSFTTFLMGILVDEGKLDWDQPLRSYLPEFRMVNSTLAEGLTPRDLVTHRSGLPRHDLSWYNNQDLSRSQIVERLGRLEPSEQLRSRYQYNNLMFLTAGYLIEQLTGMSWEDAVRARIFEPLGMKRSNFQDSESQKDPDHARPYREDDGIIGEIPFREVGNMGPAGSINASVSEMANWILLQLNKGTFGGRKLIESTTLREMHTPQMAISSLPDAPEVSPASYGMGWVIDSYRGHYRVYHGGAIDGFTAQLVLFPNDGIGLVAIVNANGTALPGLVINHAVDRLLDLPPKDWSGEALARRALARKAAKEAESRKTAVRRTGTRSSHPLDDYTGEYESDGYGVLKIEKVAPGRLQTVYNHIVTPIEHWHFDVFNGLKNEKDPTFEDMKYNFRTDLSGNIFAVEALFEPRVGPVLFRKRPEAKLSDPDYLRQFTGEYQLGAQTVLISLRGSRLILTIGNQRPYPLEPDIDGWFNLGGLSGFRARLSTGKVEISQPNGLFTATRK